MGRIYDITIEMNEAMPAFPGDEKVFMQHEIMNANKGDPYSIKKLCMLTHTGTHLDAPAHYFASGLTLDKIDLTSFCGEAMVIEIRDPEKISLEEIKDIELPEGSIVLFKTANSARWATESTFYENFVYISGEVAQFLMDHQVKLVGIDYLSADKYGDVVAHNILLGNNIPILEGIDLSAVSAGRYKLVCLPLKANGLDGSPVRAILEEV